MSKRRGETLVEVVVSFAIISLVMMGISGLISSLVGMITESRTVTQATALAQQGLVDGVAVVRSRCDIRDELSVMTLPSSALPGSTNGLGLNKDTNSDGLKLEVTLNNLSLLADVNPEENVTASAGLLNANGFRKVISKVTWKDKLGADQSYTLVQVVQR